MNFDVFFTYPGKCHFITMSNSNVLEEWHLSQNPFNVKPSCSRCSTVLYILLHRPKRDSVLITKSIEFNYGKYHNTVPQSPPPKKTTTKNKQIKTNKNKIAFEKNAMPPHGSNFIAIHQRTRKKVTSSKSRSKLNFTTKTVHMVKMSLLFTKDKKVGHCPLGQGIILTQGFNINLDTGPPNNISSKISKL
jgi:hypothetical protein